jgi:cytoskeletal protein CcmA (bactofilin family)
MFSRNPPGNGAAPPKPGKSGPQALSFIGPEVVISGHFTTSAQVQIDGRIDGDVRCAQLCQGESGIIAGDIHADEARIAGLVQGTVSAGTIIVEASGRISGDVSYDTISIAAGAQIDGRLARREALAQSAAPVLVATVTEPKADETPATRSELFARDDKRAVAG